MSSAESYFGSLILERENFLENTGPKFSIRQISRKTLKAWKKSFKTEQTRDLISYGRWSCEFLKLPEGDGNVVTPPLGILINYSAWNNFGWKSTDLIWADLHYQVAWENSSKKDFQLCSKLSIIFGLISMQEKSPFQWHCCQRFLYSRYVHICFKADLV